MTKETFIKELDKILKQATINETIIEELEKIKTEIIELTEYFYIEPDVIHIIDKHISELKGDNNVVKSNV